MMTIKTIQWLIVSLILISFIACEDDKSNNSLEPEIEDPISITQPYKWKLSSTPLSFAESALSNDLTYGYNRAKLSWYQVDPLFLRDSPRCPPHIRSDFELINSVLVREVWQQWIYPNRQSPYGQPVPLPVLNLTFYPAERGPYNYDAETTSYSGGLSTDGLLNAPASRWGGIMQDISEYTDVKYIEFWLMDPFLEQHTQGGDLYINIGFISEDVLKDDYLAHESKFDCQQLTNIDNTNAWGMAPVNVLPQDYFSQSNKTCQDQGIDGLSDDEERDFYVNYLARVKNHCTPEAFSQIQSDPSADNYHNFLGEDYNEKELNIIERYKYFTGLDKNSIDPNDSYSDVPDSEDLNKDLILNNENAYAEIKIPIRPTTLDIDQTFIIEKSVTPLDFTDGSSSYLTWYHFKIPVDQFNHSEGSFQNADQFESIRLYLTNFESPAVLRMTEFHLTKE